MTFDDISSAAFPFYRIGDSRGHPPVACDSRGDASGLFVLTMLWFPMPMNRGTRQSSINCLRICDRTIPATVVDDQKLPIAVLSVDPNPPSLLAAMMMTHWMK